ncbi:MAG: altronate dehydratase family protein [Phycisphaerae bacterium]|nr:altronate dehydratase family protein [Phycisphaerae bacterium]MDW8262277.1 altronate dehydratase family protein [Phycisphaerales bacterium]
MAKLLRIHEIDNVAVALERLAAGQVVEGLRLQGDIPQAHKVALRAIRRGEPVIKYGYPIGYASQDIAAGEHVHTHNVASGLRGHLSELKFRPNSAETVPQQPSDRTFAGYRRPDGSVATRNEIWIVNTVGCVNHASERIAAAARKALEGTAVEGVYAFPHPFGCSQLGDDLANTQKVLAGLVNHPNAAAVLILGLGCENNQMKLFLERVGRFDPARVKFFNAQDVADEVESGVETVHQLADYASQFHRQPTPVRELILGGKCGGSDGFSGITANPLVGRIADRHCSAGGTMLLTEVPEMFGAEEVLLDRAADEAVFHATIDLVNSFRDYFRRYNQPIDENPSPGNKDGGITTLAEKSLGCVQKGGRAPVKQVLAYGERASPGLGGLALINAPGNDGVSSTAMTIAGAHVLLFTTGRGTPMGFPAPTIKISSNSTLAERKPQWIDFDAGVLASEGATLDEAADQLFQLVIEVASGTRKTRNEQHGYREIAIWKNGVTL